jgi:hypothetical protein
MNNTAVCECCCMRLLSWQKHPTLGFIIVTLNLDGIYCSGEIQMRQ